MTGAKRFKIEGSDVVREPHHYRACGLDDVYLLNGLPLRKLRARCVCAKCGAIGLRVISDKKPVSAREFRFLRKQMGFTQEQLAKRLRIDAQTVARYEKDQTAIPGSTDAVMRFLYAVYLIPADQRMKVLTELAEELEERDSKSGRAMYFRQTNHGWDKGQ